VGHVRRTEGLLGLGAVLACALALAPAAGAVLVKLQNGDTVGIQFRNTVNPAFVPGLVHRSGAAADRRAHVLPADDTCVTPDNGAVCWGGGPVLHSVAPYLILWEPPSVSQGISASSQALLTRYLTDVAADARRPDTEGVLRQYSDSAGFAAQSFMFSTSHVIVDSDAYPSPSECSWGVAYGYDFEPPFTDCVTDDAIRDELTALVAKDHLPMGLGPNAPVYFVVTPEATDVCAEVGSCADPEAPDAFCGYHENFSDGGEQVVYAVVPFSTETFGPKGCQTDGNDNPELPNGDFADTIVDNMSHELNEAITDPDANDSNGWTDSNDGNEVADECEEYGSTDPQNPNEPTDPSAYAPALGGSAADGNLYDQSINGDRYYSQTVWSNGNLNCDAAPVSDPLSAAFSAPAPAPAAPGTVLTFNPDATIAAAGVSSATWSFGDGSSLFATGSLADVEHRYAASGRYQATLTVVDEDGQLSAVSHPIVSGTPPEASFIESTTAAATGVPVAFSATRSRDTNGGGSIAAYAWSFGDGGTGTGAAPKHTYSRPGVYSVALTVADALGLTGTETERITVGPAGEIAKLALRKSGKAELLIVKVSGPGSVRLGNASRRLAAAGRVSFKIGSAPKKHHRLRLKVIVVYTPRFGPVVVKTYRGVVSGR
jgi:PKD repeat protein